MTTINFGEAKLKQNNPIPHTKYSKNLKNTFEKHHADDVFKLEMLDKDVMISTFKNNSVAELVDRGTEKFSKKMAYQCKPDASTKQSARDALKFFFNKMKIK